MKTKIKEELEVLYDSKEELLLELSSLLKIMGILRNTMKVSVKELKNCNQLISHYDYLLNNPHLERFYDRGTDNTVTERNSTIKKKRKDINQ